MGENEHSRSVEKNEKTTKIEDENRTFNPVISQNLLNNSFENISNNQIVEDEKQDENSIFAYEQNANEENKNEDLEKAEDSNKIDLSDGRLDTILGINQ